MRNTWGCKFSCGKRYTSDYLSMLTHEIGCWKNPENKTCNTCKHGKRVFNDDYDECGREYQEWIKDFWDCGVTDKPTKLFEMIEDLPDEEKSKKVREPFVNCESWESE